LGKLFTQICPLRLDAGVS